jgi:hypothetical protein
MAPGADTLKELFRDDPVLVVLDELDEYLRRVQGMGGRDQLTVFLKALLGAIESTPRAAVTWGVKRTAGSVALLPRKSPPHRPHRSCCAGHRGWDQPHFEAERQQLPPPMMGPQRTRGVSTQ